MRTLVILLLLANLSLLAYLQLDGLAGSEANRLAHQINADQLRPLSSQQVKEMGLDKPATPPAVCLEWGPFAESEKSRANAALEAIAQGHVIASRPVEVTTAYWVFVPPVSNKASADKKLAELKALGVPEMYLVQDAGAQKLAISLGLFRTEEAASNYLAAMQKLGVKSARLAPRTQTLSQTLLVLRDPPAEAAARLQESKADFPGAELRTTSCNGKAG